MALTSWTTITSPISLDAHASRHEDGGADAINISNLGILRTALTTQFDKSNTALANVLSLTLAASTKYILEADLFVDANATGGHKYALDGTVTVTGIKYEVESVNNITSQLILTDRLTALAGTSGQAGATQAHTRITGVIASSAAGTINVQFAQQAASGTSSILTLSSFKALKI